MEKSTKQALEKEWSEEARIRHNEIYGSREQVKSEFVAALKARETELRMEAREARADKPLGQRIAEASGYSATKQSVEIQLVRDVLRDVNRESLKGTSYEQMTFASRMQEDKQREVSAQRGGHSNYFESRSDYVQKQAKDRLDSFGNLQPANKDHRVEMAPEQQEALKAERSARINALVTDMTTVEQRGASYHTNNTLNRVERELYKEVNLRRNEDVTATNQFRARESGAYAEPDEVPSQLQDKTISLESINATAAISHRAELAKEALAENHNAAVESLSTAEAETWVQADKRDLRAIDNQDHATDAVEAINGTVASLPVYAEEAETARLTSDAEQVLSNAQDKAAQDQNLPDKEKVLASERAAYMIESSFRDMRQNGHMNVDELTTMEAETMAVRNIADLAQISHQEIANTPAETIAYNMHHSKDYADAAERMLQQLEKDGSSNIGVARAAMDHGREYVSEFIARAREREEQSVTEESQQEMPNPNNAMKQNHEALSSEQQGNIDHSAQAGVDNAQATVAATATIQQAENDPFGEPYTPPAPSAQTEQRDDPLGSAYIKPEPQESLPQAQVQELNSIEPVNVREAVNREPINDPKGPMEAANAAVMGREEIVLDEQTRANLARARAADRQATEAQLGHVPGEPRQKAPEKDADEREVKVTARDNQVESDEILTASREAKKTVIPPDVQRHYVNVDNKYYSQKNPSVVAFEDKGNRLETRMNNEEVASNLVKIAEARGWDEIKVTGTENFRKEVWMEAAARGMHVKGYKPSEADKASLEARVRTRDANTVEQAQTREQTKPTKEQERAAAFQNDGKAEALKKHPELAGAYAAQAAAMKKLDSTELSDKEKTVVRARINENLNKNIEKGQIPEVQRKEEKTVVREKTEELERSR
jgi:hypothetical protein